MCGAVYMIHKKVSTILMCFFFFSFIIIAFSENYFPLAFYNYNTFQENCIFCHKRMISILIINSLRNIWLLLTFGNCWLDKKCCLVQNNSQLVCCIVFARNFSIDFFAHKKCHFCLSLRSKYPQPPS